jgi:hypothetical protein
MIAATSLQKGATLAQVVAKLQGAPAEGGKALAMRVEDRCKPYLDHVLAGFVDGPPTSVVAWVLSGKDPGAQAWRRFTLTRVAPYTYELGAFPTPFHNANDPLSPGVPPTASRR